MVEYVIESSQSSFLLYIADTNGLIAVQIYEYVG